ncbi:MAG TPA: MAPEG family protein [Allosphingosinicella sp.]|nr:MAPEG family protein [Allosphingosinicella sp.]
MTRDQKIVLAGAASGIAAMILAMWLLSTRLLPPPSGLETLADRLGYALRWTAFAALPVLAMLAAVGNARFLTEAIDPTRGAEDRGTIVNGRVADNTTQQFLLFMAGSLGLAASLSPGRMQAIAAAAIVFVVARLAFWIGYRIDPLYRAFGFAATAYLNLGLLLAALWLGFA